MPKTLVTPSPGFISIAVSDAQRSAAFYEEYLGAIRDTFDFGPVDRRGLPIIKDCVLRAPPVGGRQGVVPVGRPGHGVDRVRDTNGVRLACLINHTCEPVGPVLYFIRHGARRA